MTQRRLLVSCNWSWHSHGNLIPWQFDLKINPSMKTPSQEYHSRVACSYSQASVQTLDCVAGLHNCWEFFQLPTCLDEATYTQIKFLYCLIGNVKLDSGKLCFVSHEVHACISTCAVSIYMSIEGLRKPSCLMYVNQCSGEQQWCILRMKWMAFSAVYLTYVISRYLWASQQGYNWNGSDKIVMTVLNQ